MEATTQHPDVALAEFVSKYRQDPLGYVKVAFPWGEPGTPLEFHKGPCPCQIKILTTLRDEIRKRNFDGHTPVAPIRIGVGTGHGVGKSACIGMLDNFIRSTRPRCRGMILANTGDQLSTKTWANIRSWNKLSITGHWFEDTTERINRIGERETWFSSAVIWSSDRSEAIAGLHAADSTPYYLNDECSAIDDIIFEVQEGGLTDGEPIQLCFGNPTQPTGKFARIMNGQERGWIVIRIDSRECTLTNKAQIQEWVEAYGEDSDFVRVRVRGLPPKGSIHGYFGETLIQDARKARPRGVKTDALVAAWDAAWGGDDSNKLRFREGLDAWSIKPVTIPGRETARPEKMIQVLAEQMTKVHPVTSGGYKRIAMLFGDGSGICTEVFAGLYSLGITNVMSINWSGEPRDARIHKNIKAQIMSGLRDDLLAGLGIDDNEDLAQDMRELLAVNFLPLQFEKKELMKKRLGRSTDDLDALAMLGYMPVVLPDAQRAAAGWQNRNQQRYTPASPFS